MTRTSRRPWLLRADEAPADDSGSTEVEYHRAYAHIPHRLLRGIAAIGLLALGFVMMPAGLRLAADAIDANLGRAGEFTWLTHLSGMVGLALLIPWSMIIQRIVYGVGIPSLSSVTSHFRFALFAKALLVLGPLWVIMVTAGNLVPMGETSWSPVDLVAILVITLLLTPLQAAGEEYAVRGLFFRVLGSSTRGARTGLVLGVIVTSVLFTLVHGAGDAYIIAWYLTLWAGLAVITWRTGGLEVAIVLHALVNTMSFVSVLVLRANAGDTDRSAGAGSPLLLGYIAVVVLTTAVVWWQTREVGPVRENE